MVSLFHRDLGGAGQAPLVLLHGMLGSSRNWLTAGRDLAARYHVLAPDLRNHGLSPHAPTHHYADLVDDVLGWLDAQDLGRVRLVGHSMGGKVAMLLACRHPGRVGQLTVVDIAPRGYHWVGHRASFAAMNELNLGDLRSRADAELRLESRVRDLGLRKFLATNLERGDDGAWRWTINLPVLTAALGELEANPLAPEDRFDGPSLFVAGGRSAYVEAEDEPVITRMFPASRLVRLAESGHNPHMEAREAFTAAVLAGGD